ncbi:YncE family protein [uncultured Gordonia sp.]|uniref:YncE family protein n=1 Tax=uncultured Gordonia sp. TaxID=198437 RepID=UPI00258C24A2|nr:hypothetical protein [uncultured Gordonia sp.]
MGGMSASRSRATARTSARRTIGLLVPLAAAALVVAGCNSSSGSQTPTDVATVTPASASPAPPGVPRTPAGVTVPTPAGSASPALSDGRLAVIGPGGTAVLRFDESAMTAAASATPGALPTATSVATPALTHLVGTGDGGFIGVGPGHVVRIGPDGQVRSDVLRTENPSALARTPDGRTLVGTENGHVLVLDRDLAQQRDIAGFVRVDDITVSPPGADLPGEQVVVLDRAQSSVTPVDLGNGDLGPALRAGNGATNSAVDHYGRVLVANTRDDEIVGFFGSPLVMRFRYPVSDGPYAVDYDDARNLLWVSTTGNNEVVAYDLATGEPAEKHRFAAVAQPDAIVVDDASGTVFVLSARDGGIQVVTTAAQTGGALVPPTATGAAPTSATTAPATTGAAR